MKVTIKDYQAIKHAELVFDKGLTAIIGPTNSGKSSIIRAIKGAINNQAGNQFINYDSDQATVTIEDNNSIISWVKNRKGPSSYIINGEELSKIGTKQNEDVANLLNMNEIEVGTSKIRLNFWDQMEKAFLMDRNPGQLFNFISQSKEQEVITEYRDDKKKDLDSVNQQVKTIHTSVNIVTDEIRLLKEQAAKMEFLDTFNTEVIEYLYNINKSVTEQIRKHTELTNTKDNYLMRLNSLNKHIDPIIEAEATLKQFMPLYNTLATNTAKHKANEIRQDELQQELEATINAIEKITASINILEDIITEHSALVKLQQDLDNKVKQQLTYQTKRLNLIKNIDQLEKEIIELQKELDSIEYCPYCNSDLTKGDHNHAK